LKDSNFVFEGYISNYNWVYDYLDTLLHDRLWVSQSPFSPIGALRFAQFRVQNLCDGDLATQSKAGGNECLDLTCFSKKMSPRCN